VYAVSLENSGRINLYPPGKERVVRPLKRPAMASSTSSARSSFAFTKKLYAIKSLAAPGFVRRAVVR
jgi:hypothetical protein